MFGGGGGNTEMFVLAISKVLSGRGKALSECVRGGILLSLGRWLYCLP